MMRTGRLTPSSIVVRGAPLGADLGGETVLMSVESGRYYGLDEIGSEIWRRLESPQRVDALCAALEMEYDAAPETIARDVAVLLDDLLAHELIAVTD